VITTPDKILLRALNVGRWIRSRRLAASALVVRSVIGADDVFAQAQLPSVTVDAPNRQSAARPVAVGAAERAFKKRRTARAATAAAARTQTAAPAPSARGGRETATAR